MSDEKKLDIYWLKSNGKGKKIALAAANTESEAVDLACSFANKQGDSDLWGIWSTAHKIGVCVIDGIEPHVFSYGSQTDVQ